MSETPIDAAELRLLSHIIALVLDEQPGQSAAALEALRRRAAASRTTAGALKNLFERLTAEQQPAGGQGRALLRLQLDLDAAHMQMLRVAAENAELHRRAAEAERLVRQFEARELARRRAGGMPPLFTPPPRSRHAAGLLAGCLLTLLALGLGRDQAAGLGMKFGCTAVIDGTARLARQAGFVVDLPHPAGSAGAPAREAADVYATVCR